MSEATPDSLSGAGGRERPRYQARVERIFDHAYDTRSLFLRMAEGLLGRYLPGMFISISIPLQNETRVRPYTIASSDDDGEPFEICFNRVPGGAGVAWLFERNVGDMLSFTGPFGTFVFDRAPAVETVFIAEGTAVAAIRPMIRRALALKSGQPIRMLYAADSAEHILYRAELEAWAAAHPEFRFETLVAGPDRDGLYVRLAAEVARRWVDGDTGRARNFYVGGIGKGVLKLRDLLRGAGYERRSVRYEMW